MSEIVNSTARSNPSIQLEELQRPTVVDEQMHSAELRCADDCVNRPESVAGGGCDVREEAAYQASASVVEEVEHHREDLSKTEAQSNVASKDSDSFECSNRVASRAASTDFVDQQVHDHHVGEAIRATPVYPQETAQLLTVPEVSERRVRGPGTPGAVTPVTLVHGKEELLEPRHSISLVSLDVEPLTVILQSSKIALSSKSYALNMTRLACRISHGASMSQPIVGAALPKRLSSPPTRDSGASASDESVVASVDVSQCFVIHAAVKSTSGLAASVRGQCSDTGALAAAPQLEPGALSGGTLLSDVLGTQQSASSGEGVWRHLSDLYVLRKWLGLERPYHACPWLPGPEMANTLEGVAFIKSYLWILARLYGRAEAAVSLRNEGGSDQARSPHPASLGECSTSGRGSLAVEEQGVSIHSSVFAGGPMFMLPAPSPAARGGPKVSGSLSNAADGVGSTCTGPAASLKCLAEFLLVPEPPFLSPQKVADGLGAPRAHAVFQRVWDRTPQSYEAELGLDVEIQRLLAAQSADVPRWGSSAAGGTTAGQSGRLEEQCERPAQSPAAEVTRGARNRAYFLRRTVAFNDRESASGENSGGGTRGESDAGALATVTRGIMALARKKLTDILRFRTPIRELKPDKISPLMIKTGALHSAFISLEKMSICAASELWSLDQFCKLHARERAWHGAVQTLLNLMEAYEAECVAQRRVGEAFDANRLTHLWPWRLRTAIKLLKSTPRTEHHSMAPRPLPPSLRLAVYLQRSAGILQESARPSACSVIDDEFFQSTFHHYAFVVSERHSHIRAHLEFHERQRVRGPPSAVHKRIHLEPLTLAELQDELLRVIATGKGDQDTMDLLDSIDEQTSCINDVADAANEQLARDLILMHDSIATHFMRVSLPEWIMAHKLSCEASMVMWEDFRNTLDTDLFLEEEDLPFLHEDGITSGGVLVTAPRAFPVGGPVSHGGVAPHQGISVSSGTRPTRPSGEDSRGVSQSHRERPHPAHGALASRSTGDCSRGMEKMRGSRRSGLTALIASVLGSAPATEAPGKQPRGGTDSVHRERAKGFGGGGWHVSPYEMESVAESNRHSGSGSQAPIGGADLLYSEFLPIVNNQSKKFLMETTSGSDTDTVDHPSTRSSQLWFPENSSLPSTSDSQRRAASEQRLAHAHSLSELPVYSTRNQQHSVNFDSESDDGGAVGSAIHSRSATNSGSATYRGRRVEALHYDSNPFEWHS